MMHPQIIEVAKAISGTDHPPEWLVECLLAWRGGIAGAIRSEAEFPPRPAHRQRLADLVEAARLIERELLDPAMSSSLLVIEPRQDWIGHDREIVEGLRDVARRAEACLNAVPIGSGMDKFYPRRDVVSAKDSCILAVALAWEKVHGKWPGLRNEEAHRAYVSLWTAAGGSGERQGIDVWCDHMRVINKKLRDGPLARVMSKDLEGFARGWGLKP